MLERWRFERGLRAAERSDEAVLRDYATADWVSLDTPVTEADLLAVDFELDGLGRGAHLLQAGWVPFTASAISLGDAVVSDIRSTAELDRQAVTIHGIGNTRAEAGESVRSVMTSLLRALSGRVLVAHGAAIETEAIAATCRKLFGIAPPIRAICTLVLERHLVSSLVGGEAYRLGPTRARYGLPEYRAHDALGDALAAAELLLAQMTRLDPNIALKRIMKKAR